MLLPRLTFHIPQRNCFSLSTAISLPKVCSLRLCTCIVLWEAIHQVLIKKIFTVTLLGYLILINLNFFSVFSVVLVSVEKIYRARNTMFDPHFQTPCSLSKILRYFVFSTLFSVFEDVVKHGLSWLIYSRTSRKRPPKMSNLGGRFTGGCCLRRLVRNG